MTKDEFLDPENWSGGPCYELGICWPSQARPHLLRAVRAMWQAPVLTGPWLEREDFGGPVQFPTLGADGLDQAYGVLRLAGGHEVTCHASAMLDGLPDGFDDPPTHRDWLFLFVHRGIQERLFNVVYSDQFRADNPWFLQFDAAYLAIAEAIYAASPFTLAVIDTEGYSTEHGPDRLISEQAPRGGLLLPPATRARYPLPEEGVFLPSGLWWLAPRDVEPRRPRWWPFVSKRP